MKLLNSANVIPVSTSHKSDLLKQVLLKNGEVPHLTQCAIATISLGQVVEKHSHKDMYEIFFVLKGDGKLIVNAEEHRVTKGDSFTIEPNEPHSIINDSNEDLVLYYFGIVE